MSACPEPARLAAAASGEDLGAERHADDCRTCRVALDAQLAVRHLATRLPPVVVAPARRRALEAEILAIADLDEPAVVARRAPRWRRVLLAAALLAAALAVVAIVQSRRRSAQRKVPAPVADRAGATTTVVPLADEPAPAAVVTAAIAAPADARFERQASGDRERVVVRDGTLAIDARDSPRGLELGGLDPASVSVHADGARIEVRAAGGVIHSVHVFAGSVEIVAAGKTIVVTAGATWEAPARAARPARPAPVATPPAPTAAAFADGWAALHAGDNHAAAAHFRVAAAGSTVAEDAGYWLAVAEQRDHDDAAAITAFEAFLAAFPSSPHAGDAHLSLWRLLAARDPQASARHRAAASADADPRIRAAAAE